jgi:hypothetical protein
MILWHLGITVMVVRYVYRDPAMDLRWVLAGSLLPDLVDKPIGSLWFHDTFGTHRLLAHALLFPVVLLGVVVAVTRRGSPLRKGLIALVIGVLLHLALDAAWIDPEAFWWPLFGIDFPEQPDSALGPLLRRMLTDPLVWAGEAIGAAYLAYLWRVHLREPAAAARFAVEGRIPLRRA